MVPPTCSGLFRKLVASSALLAGAVAFAVFFGPRPTPAFADIYAPLGVVAGLVPPPGAPTLRVGTAYVNGEPFQYTVGHSRLALDDVLTHYERQFQTRTAPSMPLLPTGVRMQGDTAGVVAGVKVGAVLHPRDFVARFRAFGETRQFDEIGQFHVISAYEADGTVFIAFTPQNGVRIDRLLPGDTGGDAPGEDLRGVRRPAGLQRLLTIEHGEGAAWSRTWIYRAGDGIAAAADFGRAFRAAGWIPNPAFASNAVAHFSDGKFEAFLGGTGSSPDAAVVLVYRRLAGANNP